MTSSRDGFEIFKNWQKQKTTLCVRSDEFDDSDGKITGPIVELSYKSTLEPFVRLEAADGFVKIELTDARFRRTRNPISLEVSLQDGRTFVFSMA